jgi:hypothetical protein
MRNNQLEEDNGPARFTLPRGIHIKTSSNGPNEVLNLITKQDGDTVMK